MANALSVSQLNNYIKGMFFDELLLHNIEVYGEITEFKISGSNAYISLKENDCTISCIMFGFSETMPVGTKVKVFGSVNFYQKNGSLGFNAKTIKPFGEGEYYLKLLKLKEKLKNEGLFESRKTLPVIIKSVALITSLTGAVVHDYLSVMKGRNNIDTYIINARVQGENADKEIISAINLVNSIAGKFDCIVIARGGGANIDLDIFNSEELARAVAYSAVPVISAVGHEIDYTLCDLCAGTRAGTPSIAAEIIASKYNAVYNKINCLAENLTDSAIKCYQRNELKLNKYETKISAQATLKFAVNKNKLEHFIENLKKNADNLMTNRRNRVFEISKNISLRVQDLIKSKESEYTALEKLTEKSNPLKILASGYAKITLKDKAVNSITEINPGDKINIFLSDGQAVATINEKNKLKVK